MFGKSNATKRYLEKEADDDQGWSIGFGIMLYFSSSIADFNIILILDSPPES